MGWCREFNKNWSDRAYIEYIFWNFLVCFISAMSVKLN